MGATAKRCWVIVEGWERTGPLLGVRDTYEAAVLEAANRYVGQRFRVAESVIGPPYDVHEDGGPIGGTWLEEAAGVSGDTAQLVCVSLWPAELRFLQDQEGRDG